MVVPNRLNMPKRPRASGGTGRRSGLKIRGPFGGPYGFDPRLAHELQRGLRGTTSPDDRRLSTTARWRAL